MNTHHIVNTVHISTSRHTISMRRVLEFDTDLLATQGDNDILISYITCTRVFRLEILVLPDLLGL
jgi:hypothetical protein